MPDLKVKHVIVDEIEKSIVVIPATPSAYDVEVGPPSTGTLEARRQAGWIYIESVVTAQNQTLVVFAKWDAGKSKKKNR